MGWSVHSINVDLVSKQLGKLNTKEANGTLWYAMGNLGLFREDPERKKDMPKVKISGMRMPNCQRSPARGAPTRGKGEIHRRGMEHAEE
jgi:hypothetical protein